MYVVKVGEYYVSCRDIVGEIILSKSKMRGYNKITAESIAKKLNAEVIEINEEVISDK